MRPISYRKGTLCLGVPNAAVEACAGAPQFRSRGREWAFRLPLRDGSEFRAAGWYEHRDGSILRGGAVVEALPEWWADGRAEDAEPWAVASMFGTGGMLELAPPLTGDETLTPVEGVKS